MGTTSRIISVFSRAVAFISSIVVCAIAGSFIRHLDIRNMDHGGRVDYVLTLSCLSILFSLLLLPPLRYSFWAFPLDCAMFVMWMVAFGLLVNLSPACKGIWYRWVWMWAWRTNHRCGTWRTLLAFSFLNGIMWLVNTVLGIYNTFQFGSKRRPEAVIPIDHNRVRTEKRASHDSWRQPMTEPANYLSSAV